VNLADAALVPPTVLTVTYAAPALAAGDLHVIEVALTTVTFVATAVPNFTVAPAANPVPVNVTAVPPDVGPAAGASDTMAGVIL
jgi:hypothetical protein